MSLKAAPHYIVMKLRIDILETQFKERLAKFKPLPVLARFKILCKFVKTYNHTFASSRFQMRGKLKT